MHRASKATATSGRAIVCSPIISTSATARARTATTTGIFALVSFVKSVRLPAGPPTAASVPLVFAKAAADVWRSSPSSRVVCVFAACFGTTTIWPAVPPWSTFTANEARSCWEGGAPWMAASTKYPESNNPGDWRLELLEVLRRRQRAAELRDAGLDGAEPARRAAGRPTAPAMPAAAGPLRRELAEPGLDAAAPVLSAPSPAVSWPPPVLSWPMPLARAALPLRSFAMPPCSCVEPRGACQAGRQVTDLFAATVETVAAPASLAGRRRARTALRRRSCAPR